MTITDQIALYLDRSLFNRPFLPRQLANPLDLKPKQISDALHRMRYGDGNRTEGGPQYNASTAYGPLAQIPSGEYFWARCE